MTNKNPVQRKLHNGLSKFFQWQWQTLSCDKVEGRSSHISFETISQTNEISKICPVCENKSEVTTTEMVIELTHLEKRN